MERLETVFESELYHTRRDERVDRTTESREIDLMHRHAKMGSIKSVEELRSKLQLLVFCKSEPFAKGQVD